MINLDYDTEKLINVRSVIVKADEQAATHPYNYYYPLMSFKSHW